MNDRPAFTFGSLFSGIGGLDLGLERAGMRCAWQVEINDYATKVLQKHWPHVARFRDVRECGEHNLAPVDLLAGGFPCQPHSQAGERKASSDERDLWPEFARIIREIRPTWVVAENVLGLLSSEDGNFFGGILGDLATLGYDARWCVLSAAEFGAPHLRERVFLVAHASNILVRTRANISGSMGEAPAGSDREGTCSLCYPFTCKCSPMAHASGTEWWTSPKEWGNVTDWTDSGWQEATGGPELCCEELAYPGCPRRQECSTTTVSDESGYTAWRKIAPGLVESSTSRRERQYQESRRAQGAQSLFEQPGAWATQPGMGRDLTRVPPWMDGDINEKEHQNGSNEVLSDMQQAPGAEEVQQQAGGLSGIRAAPVLQSEMYGDSKNERRANTGSVPKTGSQTSRFILPEMWDNGEFAGTPPRQQPCQQQLIKSSNAVRLLSCQMALAEWEKIAEKTVGVQALRTACAQIGYVPETLSALQEVWQSLSHQKKSWVIVYAGERCPWPAGPGEEQYDWEPSRVVTDKVPNRTARLKGLGNAVVPALAEFIGRCIMASAMAERQGVA